MANDAKTYSVVAEPREVLGKASRQLRRQGLIPGVVYGHDIPSQSVQVSKKEFDHTYMRAGSNILVDLVVGEGGKPRKVFIHDVQRNPINHNVTHIDFMVVNLLEEMTVHVPIVLVGESPIVRNNEGLLQHQLEYITVKALPMDIPSRVEVDISGLTEMDQTIHVSDLELPEKVELLSNPDEQVAKITQMPVVVEEVKEVAEEETSAEDTSAGEEDES